MKLGQGMKQFLTLTLTSALVIVGANAGAGLSKAADTEEKAIKKFTYNVTIANASADAKIKFGFKTNASSNGEGTTTDENAENGTKDYTVTLPDSATEVYSLGWIDGTAGMTVTLNSFKINDAYTFTPKSAKSKTLAAGTNLDLGSTTNNDTSGYITNDYNGSDGASLEVANGTGTNQRIVLKVTASASATPTAGATPSASPAASTDPSATPAASASPAASPTASTDPSASPAASVTPSASSAVSASPSVSPAASTDPSASPAASTDPSASPAVSASPSASPAAVQLLCGPAGDMGETIDTPFTAQLDNSGSFNDQNGTPENAESQYKVTRTGEYYVSAVSVVKKADLRKSGSLWIQTDLKSMPTNFDILAESLFVNGKEYLFDEKNARLYNDNGSIRVGIANERNQDAWANPFAKDTVIPVEKGDVITVKFKVYFGAPADFTGDGEPLDIAPDTSAKNPCKKVAPKVKKVQSIKRGSKKSIVFLLTTADKTKMTTDTKFKVKTSDKKNVTAKIVEPKKKTKVTVKVTVKKTAKKNKTVKITLTVGSKSGTAKIKVK